MEEIKIKKFNINEMDEITLLSVEEARKVPKLILACDEWWWLRSPGNDQYFVASVFYDGGISERSSYVFVDDRAVRPAFRINNLESKIGESVRIGKTWCTVIDVDLVLTDYPICMHRFDEKSNNWENSELKEFINSDEFKAMI